MKQWLYIHVHFYFSSPWVKVNGITYKESVIVALKPGTDLDDPTFGQIRAIYICDNSIYANVRVLLTEEYSEHYCVYVLSYSQEYVMTALSSVASYMPLSPYNLISFPNNICVSPKFIIR